MKKKESKISRRKPVKRLFNYLGGWGPLEEVVGDVDEEIHSLVLELNRSGYRTTYSCAGGPEHEHPICTIGVYAGFKVTEGDLEEVARIIRCHTDLPFQFGLARGRRSLEIILRGPIEGPVDLVQLREGGDTPMEDFGPPEVDESYPSGGPVAHWDDKQWWRK